MRNMVREKIEDPRALFIRLTQWKVNLQTLMNKLTGDDPLPAKEEINEFIAFTERIYLPVAESTANANSNLSVFLEETLDFKGLKNAIGDLWLQVTHPRKYNHARAMIDEQIRKALKEIDKRKKTKIERNIQDPEARAKVALTAIRDYIRESLPEDMRDQCFFRHGLNRLHLSSANGIRGARER